MLEVLDDFPSARPPIEWILQTGPRLKCRQFSIASSLAAHPGQAHVLVAVVSYRTPHGRLKKGLCSNWLAGLAPHKGKHFLYFTSDYFFLYCRYNTLYDTTTMLTTTIIIAILVGISIVYSIV